MYQMITFCVYVDLSFEMHDMGSSDTHVIAFSFGNFLQSFHCLLFCITMTTSESMDILAIYLLLVQFHVDLWLTTFLLLFLLSSCHKDGNH